MTPTIGHVAVVVGLALTVYAAIAFVVAGRGGDPRVALSARRAVIGSFVMAAVACVAMVVSLLSHDFSVRYVAENNATTTPPSSAPSACGPPSRARSCSGRSSRPAGRAWCCGGTATGIGH